MDITIKGWITGRKLSSNFDLIAKDYEAPITDVIVHTSYEDAQDRFKEMSKDISWGQPFIYQHVDIKIKL